MMFLEKLLNQYLALDPASQDRAKNLYGKNFKINLTGINIILLLTFDNNGAHLIINPKLVDEFDLTITATPLSLLQLKLAKNRRKFFANSVTVEGDMLLAQQLTDFFDGIQIDWEEYFSKIVGDLPASQTGILFKKFNKTAKILFEKLTAQVNEYLHEEINLFPSKEELQDFYSDVDTFRMDTDRLAEKFRLFEDKK